MGLQIWAARPSYAGRSERTRERGFEWGSNTRGRGFLAGYIEQCPCRESKVAEILRAVLRGYLRVVLRGI